MKPVRIYTFEDSAEAIFTAVYDAWASGYGHEMIQLELEGLEECNSFQLFTEYVHISADPEKAQKVIRSVKCKLSNQIYDMIAKAVLSYESDKANVVYHFLVRAFSVGPEITKDLSNHFVRRIFEINRNIGNELQHYLGFLRFLETPEHILFAIYEPKNNLNELLAHHFEDRLGGENFIIFDQKRNAAVLHEKEKKCIFGKLTQEQINMLNTLYEKDTLYETLWKIFFKNIAIESRKNEKLQRNLCPIRFREHMLEHNPSIKS